MYKLTLLHHVRALHLITYGASVVVIERIYAPCSDRRLLDLMDLKIYVHDHKEVCPLARRLSRDQHDQEQQNLSEVRQI
nr:AIF_HP1_G0030690.mRNA.1.CDS.1 [Saccharomyces cerevisiae]